MCSSRSPVYSVWRRQLHMGFHMDSDISNYKGFWSLMFKHAVETSLIRTLSPRLPIRQRSGYNAAFFLWYHRGNPVHLLAFSACNVMNVSMLRPAEAAMEKSEHWIEPGIKCLEILLTCWSQRLVQRGLWVFLLYHFRKIFLPVSP